jgi:hypothetical protein
VVSVTPRQRFISREKTLGTHCTGGWVGLRADQDTEDRGEKFFASLGYRTPVFQSVVIPYWLSFPDSNQAKQDTIWLLETMTVREIYHCNRLLFLASARPLWQFQLNLAYVGGSHGDHTHRYLQERFPCWRLLSTEGRNGIHTGSCSNISVLPFKLLDINPQFWTVILLCKCVSDLPTSIYRSKKSVNEVYFWNIKSLSSTQCKNMSFSLRTVLYDNTPRRYG